MTCGGDSGSPLVTFDSTSRQYTQVGIVSGGTCASYSDPGIFARLEHHAILKFIQDNAWDNMPISNIKIIEKLVKESKAFRNELTQLSLKNLKLEKYNKAQENELGMLKNKNVKLENEITDIKRKNLDLTAKSKSQQSELDKLKKLAINVETLRKEVISIVVFKIFGDFELSNSYF